MRIIAPSTTVLNNNNIYQNCTEMISAQFLWGNMLESYKYMCKNSNFDSSPYIVGCIT